MPRRQLLRRRCSFWPPCMMTWKLCDLGCRTGILAIGAALLGARAVGVEIDREALAAARRNAALVGADVDFIQGRCRAESACGRYRHRDHESSLWSPEGQRPGTGHFLSRAIKTAERSTLCITGEAREVHQGICSALHSSEVHRLACPLREALSFTAGRSRP